MTHADKGIASRLVSAKFLFAASLIAGFVLVSAPVTLQAYAQSGSRSSDDDASLPDEFAEDEVDFFDTLDFLNEGEKPESETPESESGEEAPAEDNAESEEEAGETSDAATEDLGPIGEGLDLEPLEIDEPVQEEETESIGGIDIEGLSSLPKRPKAAVIDEPSWGVAVFRGLDKVTARVWMFEAPIDQVVTFGKFEVQVRRCNKRPPEETPNTTAFVEVDEIFQSGERTDVFDGWMFASSPGLNAVEHPVYDIWLIDCKIPIEPVSEGMAENVDDIVDELVIDE